MFYLPLSVNELHLNAAPPSFQLPNTLRFLACMIATLTVCALSFRPLMPKPAASAAASSAARKGCVEQIVHVDNWRNKKYVIWALSVPSALFGYFVPFVHIVRTEMNGIYRYTLQDDNSGR